MRTPNKERIRLLVDALRSGKYRQGRGRLARYYKATKKVKYCCLGVACEVARDNGLEMQRTYDALYNEYNYILSPTDRDSSLLPLGVQEWFGFGSSSPYLKVDQNKFFNTESASALNDSRGFSFLQIADAFERTYLTDAESEAE